MARRSIRITTSSSAISTLPWCIVDPLPAFRHNIAIAYVESPKRTRSRWRPRHPVAARPDTAKADPYVTKGYAPDEDHRMNTLYANVPVCGLWRWPLIG